MEVMSNERSCVHFCSLNLKVGGETSKVLDFDPRLKRLTSLLRPGALS